VNDPLARANLGDAAAAARADWRADEEAWTRAAEEQWRHNRTMRDVIRDAMHRGDRLAFVFPATTLTGGVIAVGDDVVVLDTIDGPVDVNIAGPVPLVVCVVERARTGGTRGALLTTLRARALEHEMDARDVRVGCWTAPGVFEGRVRVARDHLVVTEHEGGGEIVLALTAVAWMRRAITGR